MFFVLSFAFSVPSPYVPNSMLKMLIAIFLHTQLCSFGPVNRAQASQHILPLIQSIGTGKGINITSTFRPKMLLIYLKRSVLLSLIRPKTGNDVNLINFCKRNSPQFRRPIHLVLTRTNRLSIYPQGP